MADFSVLNGTLFSTDMPRPRALQKAQEQIAWLRSTREPQIRNLEDHVYDIEDALADAGPDERLMHLMHHHKLCLESVQQLAVEWCKELDCLRVAYEHLFIAPLMEEENGVFEEAREAASRLFK